MKTYKILIVDDEPKMLDTIVNYFESADEPYEIYKALDGALALKIFERHHPDLIITDWEMPKMSGIELIKHVRKSEEISETSIIMCTGVMVSSENLNLALEAGANDYIRKPIDKIELLARSRSMLSLSNAYKKVKENHSKLLDAYQNARKLSEIGLQITSTLSLNEIVNNIFRSLKTLMSSDVIGIGLYNKTKNSLDFTIIIEEETKLPFISVGLDDDNYLSVYCFNHQKNISISDYCHEATNYLPEIAPAILGKETQSIIYLPLNLKNNKIGVFTVQSYENNAFTDYHVNILQNLAAFITIALENSKAFELIEKQSTELKRLNASKDKIFSIIGHDLRSQLNNMKNMLQIVHENDNNPQFPSRKEFLSLSLKNAYNTSNLLEQLFLWAKSQQEKLDVSAYEHKIKPLVNDVITLLGPSAKEKDIEIETTVDENLIAFFDFNLISTVVRNLMSNAIKFTNNGGKITISARTIPGNVIVNIKDTGIGIDAEHFPKIFNEYEHFTSEGTNKERGSGLGLILCKEFVEKNGGQIWIESEIDKGSTFFFTIPIKAPSNDEKEEE